MRGNAPSLSTTSARLSITMLTRLPHLCSAASPPHGLEDTMCTGKRRATVTHHTEGRVCLYPENRDSEVAQKSCAKSACCMWHALSGSAHRQLYSCVDDESLSGGIVNYFNVTEDSTHFTNHLTLINLPFCLLAKNLVIAVSQMSGIPYATVKRSEVKNIASHSRNGD
ncbi:hypothetical protein B0H10DRAFT_12537 [Mycena sp. CBHHK59/15]|nr:hypothetical protein B0H10DRAFT_12537 [Mycena sp. CBHHK59/15]